MKNLLSSKTGALIEGFSKTKRSGRYLKQLLTLTGVSMALLLHAQMPGSISGKVLSATDKLGIPNATVTVNVKGSLVGTICDINGNFTLKPVPSGLYEVQIRFTGFEEKTVQGVMVNPGEIKFLETVYLKEGINLPPVVVPGHREELIIPDDPNKLRMNGKTLAPLPENRNIPAMLAYLSSSIYVTEGSKTINVRGSRGDDAIYIVDGIKMRGGDVSVPGGAIGSMTVYNGGVPAAYGDFTGGVIIIETKSYFDWVVEQRMKEYARAQAENEENEENEEDKEDNKENEE